MIPFIVIDTEATPTHACDISTKPLFQFVDVSFNVDSTLQSIFRRDETSGYNKHVLRNQGNDCYTLVSRQVTLCQEPALHSQPIPSNRARAFQSRQTAREGRTTLTHLPNQPNTLSTLSHFLQPHSSLLSPLLIVSGLQLFASTFDQSERTCVGVDSV